MTFYRRFIFIAFISIFLSSASTFVERETTIVVVDGKALLVDLDERGKIVTTYMEVDNYFNSDADHQSKVLEAKKTYHRLTKEQMDQIRFISMTDEEWDLDEFMVSNLVDLADHYKQTYANQIEITIPKNNNNEHLIQQNLLRINEVLTSNGVLEKDIVVEFKIDLGAEPTQFIKVVSNFKRLEDFTISE